jgi:putative ABC transport system ATP-binding protein
MEPLIRTEDLWKTYRFGRQELHAVREVSMKVEGGEFVCLMGPSGSGKSTLMNLLGCLDSPSRGRYWFAGREVSRLSENERAEIRNRRIGFVFQAFNLLPQATALENVELPLLYGPWDQRQKRALEALARVRLEDRARHRARELSGGEQQRVAIARALVTEPDIIMADEPTGNLDSQSGRQVMNVFTELNEQGVTVLLVTHDPQIAKYARRVIRVQDGKIVGDECQEGPVRDTAEIETRSSEERNS